MRRLACGGGRHRCDGSGAANAQTKYDAGASDTEIKIGTIMPFTGPAAAYATLGHTIAAYFKKVDAQGGIKGRKLALIAYDAAYNPARTLQQARRLVEDDQVLMLFASLGTQTNVAIGDSMNSKKVPPLFVASGASIWDNPKEFPWTMGFRPTRNIFRTIIRTATSPCSIRMTISARII